LLTGLGGGGAIALLALGLVLTFRASGVVNFAHGAIGMYVAYVFFELRNFDTNPAGDPGGDLVLPILGLPARVHVLDRPTVFTALLCSIGVAIALGALVYALVFRPLRSAPPLARVVASLGLFLYLSAVAQLRFVGATGQGAAALRPEFPLPSGAITIGDAVIPTSNFVVAGVTMIATAALWAIYRFTRFGLATRAASESEKGALLTGLSPDRLGYLNWILATLLAGMAVILIATDTHGIDPTTTSLAVVPALGAALLGGLGSFRMTALAGLGIGMTQSMLTTFQTHHTWLPSWLSRGALSGALPVVVILIAISLRGASLPTRATLIDRRLPHAPSPKHPAIACALVSGSAAIALLTLDAQWRLAIIVSAIATVIALSSVVLTGYVGQISLAQNAFAGLAAFTTAKLSTTYDVPFPVAPALGICVAVGIGLLAGLPAVRVRGLTLAVATIGVAVAIENLVFNSPSLLGITDVPRPRLFGVDLGLRAVGDDNFRAEFGLFAVVLVGLSAMAVANLRTSGTGMRWLAVRSNERAAAAAGINVAAAKLSAFGVSAFLAGIGGVLLAYELSSLSTNNFAVIAALASVALVYLGGIASLGGACIAGLLATGGIITKLNGGTAGGASHYQFAFSGAVLIVVAILYPDGVTGGLRHLAERTVRLVRHRRALEGAP
jgi:ABC-type branched-subunit amino acid transport system permease subunit